VQERFWSKVNQNGDCWLWTAGFDKDGYGYFHIPDGTPKQQQVKAHRYAYTISKGAIPTGLQIDHLCRVPACVNPAHLEVVTCRENLLRGNTFQAKNAQKTHCDHGHEFDEANTYIRPNGSRACKACIRNRSLEYQYRKQLKET
jgi:hypothetical protein